MNGTRKKLLLVAVAMVAVSAVVATQYARATIGYEYGVDSVNGEGIRFIGRDNATDGVRLLRIDSGTLKLQYNTDFLPGFNKTYTAAFGIVNEEQIPINITDITVTPTTGNDYMQIWLHGDPDKPADQDTSSVFMWNKGSDVTPGDTTAWTLAAGNKDVTNMDGTNALTPVDATAQVRYNDTYAGVASDGNSDFVWVQVSLDIPSGAGTQTCTGTITIEFEATNS